MDIERDVSLKTLTTLRAGGTVRALADCTSEEELRTALLFAREENIPWYVLGEGSNVLAQDEGYDGLIIRVRFSDISFEEEENGTVLVTAGAGVSWDALVREVASRGLWGIENLAGIPGTVGAAPVQNIGAYGVELKDTLSFVDALDADRGSVFRFTANECAFGYRESRFKKEHDLIILRVGFLLSKNGQAQTTYKDLARAQEEGKALSTPQEVGDVVREIRARKFPDLSEHGTAGSFFKNPVVSPGVYEKLKAQYPELPSFSAPHGMKISLAYVLDTILSLRGFRMGKAWLYDAQPLVLVLDEGGTADEVDALAEEVVRKVQDAIHISIEREVQKIVHR